MFFLKKYILTTCFIYSIVLVFAQKQTNIWYFGNRVGLDFNQVPPQPLNNGTANSLEGSSTVSDKNGRLLFYTNGIVINNRQHLKMKNAGGLAGSTSSTNNTVAVPLPGTDSIYYVFTVGAANELKQQLQYNIVNMKGDGGLGEVVPAGMNIVVEDKIFEKIAAIKHCNKKDTWIVVHKWNSDEYHAYLLTSAGISTTPVISNTGLIISGQELNALGTLKFWAKGTKLAAVHSFYNDAIELMDFDNTTGVLSNPIIIHPTSTPVSPGVYGAEFSPDGRLLYVSSNDNAGETSTLYQFDITSNNAATIVASKQIINQDTRYLAGALQTGPDQKIYMAIPNETSISVIDNPNTYGAGCNFVYNKIYVGQSVQFGLPTFLQSYFDPLSNPYDFSRSGNCSDHNVSFSINRLTGIDSVKWDFGDTHQSQSLSPSNFYVNQGFYNVKLIVYKIDCSGLNDTINHTIWITDKSDFLGPDTSTCGSIPVQLGIANIPEANYLWNTGETRNEINSSGTGEYWMEIELNGCTIDDTINVFPKTPPILNIGPDTTICAYKPIVLRAGNINGANYLWSTGETSNSISINNTGTYYVTVRETNCISSDTILVTPGDCDAFIPSAFTPNNDGKNDRFGVVTEFAVQYFSMQVFNKWGQIVFNSNDITQKWDGTFEGKNMPNGAYVWVLNYVNRKGQKVYDQGTVMLIR